MISIFFSTDFFLYLVNWPFLIFTYHKNLGGVINIKTATLKPILKQFFKYKCMGLV